MANKKVCLTCRVANIGEPLYGVKKTDYCPICGEKLIDLPHRFRPPKKNDLAKWEVVKFLTQNGFYYQHIYDNGEHLDYVNRKRSYVRYPEKMGEAKEFIVKYKNQAITD